MVNKGHGRIELIPVIKAGATDGRNCVKKAAIRTAEQLREMDSPAARWIASDVIRDVTREKAQAKWSIQNSKPA